MDIRNNKREARMKVSKQKIPDSDDKHWSWELGLALAVTLWLDCVDWLEDESWSRKLKRKDLALRWSWGGESTFKLKLFVKDSEILSSFGFQCEGKLTYRSDIIQTRKPICNLTIESFSRFFFSFNAKDQKKSSTRLSASLSL